MDRNCVASFISWLLIIFTITCTIHTSLNEASFTIHPFQRPENASSLQMMTNSGRSSRSSSPGGSEFFANAGYMRKIEKGFRGVYGELNIWSPRITQGDLSAALISVGDEKIKLSAGWMIYPEMFQDEHPRMFASYWIESSQTLCYSFYSDCHKFTMTNHGYFTTPQERTSVYLGDQYDFSIQITQDQETKRWLLLINNVQVGYWKPDVGILDDGASVVEWGGQVFKSAHSPYLPPMGSGKFPEEGHKKASYIRKMQYLNKNYKLKNPTPLRSYMSHSTYYRVSAPVSSGNGWSSFFYGGPY